MLKKACSLLMVGFVWPMLASDPGGRIRLGLTDDAPTKWNGAVTVGPGQVGRIDGGRLQDGEAVQGTTGCKSPSRASTQRRGSNVKKAARGDFNLADLAPGRFVEKPHGELVRASPMWANDEAAR